MRFSVRVIYLLQAYWRTILLLFFMIAFIVIASLFGLDEKIIALMVLIFGLISQAFAGLLSLIALIPLVGPIVVNLITLPFFIMVNGLAYLVTLIALRRGYTRQVIESRILTTTLLVGIAIGFLLGKLL